MLDTFQLQQITWAIEAGIKEGLSEQLALRDRFAMAAIQGLMASGEGGSSALDCARNAYELADAMLDARKPLP